MGRLLRRFLRKRLRVLMRLVVNVTGTSMVVQIFLPVVLGQLTVRNVHHAAAEVWVVGLRGNDQAPHVHQSVLAAFL